MQQSHPCSYMMLPSWSAWHSRAELRIEPRYGSGLGCRKFYFIGNQEALSQEKIAYLQKPYNPSNAIFPNTWCVWSWSAQHQTTLENIFSIHYKCSCSSPFSFTWVPLSVSDLNFISPCGLTFSESFVPMTPLILHQSILMAQIYLGRHDILFLWNPSFAQDSILAFSSLACSQRLFQTIPFCSTDEWQPPLLFARCCSCDV